MRSVTIIFCLVVFGCVFCRPDDKYTSKYDNIDIDEILKSERLFNNYYNCLLTGEGCTPSGRELHDHLSEALQTDCIKCTEKQWSVGKKVLTFMIENKLDLYKKMTAIYDPEGIYLKKYKARLEAEGIKLPAK